MRYYYKGVKQGDPYCLNLISEYIHLTWLRKMGYERGLNALNVFKAHAFVTIAQELSRLESQDRKSKHGKHTGRN